MKKLLLAYQISGQTVGIDLTTWNTVDLNSNEPFIAIDSGATVPSGYTDISSIENWEEFGEEATGDLSEVTYQMYILAEEIGFENLTTAEEEALERQLFNDSKIDKVTGNTGYISSFTVDGNLISSNITATGLTSSFDDKLNVVYNTIIVSPDGSGDFTLIQAAIDSVTGASTNNRFIIKVSVGDYYEDVSMKNYIIVQGVSTSTTIIFGQVSFNETSFGSTKIEDIFINTNEEPPLLINTIGLAQTNNVSMYVTWSGNTINKSSIEVQKGVIQMLGNTVVRIDDTYTGSTNTNTFMIHANGSDNIDLFLRNAEFLHNISSSGGTVGTLLNTNTNPLSIFKLNAVNTNINLTSATPNNRVYPYYHLGAGSITQTYNNIVRLSPNNTFGGVAVFGFSSGATTSTSSLDILNSAFGWHPNVSDIDVYVGAAIDVDDTVRTTGMIFGTILDSTIEVYTDEGEAGTVLFSTVNGYGQSYSNGGLTVDNLKFGMPGSNFVDTISNSITTGNSTTTIATELGITNYVKGSANIIDFINSDWSGTTQTLSGFTSEMIRINNSLLGSGYITTGATAFISNENEVTVYSGSGYISNYEKVNYVTWNSGVTDVSGYAFGQWLIYVDINGSVIYTQTEFDQSNHIKLFFFFKDNFSIPASSSVGNMINDFTTGVFNNLSRQRPFIYNDGGKISLSGITEVFLNMEAAKTQLTYNSYDNVAATSAEYPKFSTDYRIGIEGYQPNYAVKNKGGYINLRQYNDPNGGINSITGGSLTFSGGSITVTAGFDLSTELIVGDHIYLSADTITAMTRVDTISGTSLTLDYPYPGSTSTGVAYSNKAIKDLPSDKFAKYLLFRTVEDDLIHFMTPTLIYDSLSEVKAGTIEFPAYEALVISITIAEIITSSNELSFEPYIEDIRPLPHEFNRVKSEVDETVIHGETLNLTADNHPQYLRTDGTRDVTGIISYDGNKTFTGDTNIVSKKFVDDKKYDADVISGGTLLQSVIPDLNASIITGGTLLQSTIPDLDADIITGGTLLQSVIPNLDADIISGGTFAIDRLATGATTGQYLKATSPTTQSWENIVISDVTNLQTELDDKRNTGDTVPWNELDFTVSDLADITTKNSSDIDYTETNWAITNVEDGLNKLTDYTENTQGSGRLTPEVVLSGQNTQNLVVYSGTGYINYVDFHKKISWSGESISVTGYTEGTYWVYVDTNGSVQITDSLPSSVNTIRLGYFYWGGTIIGVLAQNGGIINSSLNRLVDYTLRQGNFIYDNGGLVDILGTGNTLQIISVNAKVQSALLDIQLGEISSNDAGSKYFGFYQSVDKGWEIDYYFVTRTTGTTPTNRWNDITKTHYPLTGYTVTFTNGSSLVTSTSNLTSLDLEDAYIWLSGETNFYMIPVSAVTWTGSQTNITLENTYIGVGGSGTAIANYSLPQLPNGKYAKHLVVRDTEDGMFLIYAGTYYDTYVDAVNGVLPSIPSTLEQSAIKMAGIVVTSGDTTLENNIYDIRPLPYQYRIGGQVGGGAAVTSHSALTDLDNDDHDQYLRTDGTRNLIGIQSYQSHPTFTIDTHIVDKKYVDDGLDLKLNVSIFSGYTGTTAVLITDLENNKVNRSGDTITGDLRIEQSLYVTGTTATTEQLENTSIIGLSNVDGKVYNSNIQILSTSNEVIDISGNTTITNIYGIYYVDTTAGEVTVQVPDATAENDGQKVVIIKKSGNSNVVITTTGGTQYIGGLTAQTITQNDKGLTIVTDYDNDKWIKIQDSRFLEGSTTGEFQYWDNVNNSWKTTGDHVLWDDTGYTLNIKNSGLTSTILNVDGINDSVGINVDPTGLTSFSNVNLFVNGNIAMGNSVNVDAITGNTPGGLGRQFNIIDTDGKLRLWRYNDDIGNPSVEFVWGTGATPSTIGNAWWDFSLEGAASPNDAFQIRRRTEEVDTPIYNAYDNNFKMHVDFCAEEYSYHTKPLNLSGFTNSTPNEGDLWHEGNNLYFERSGDTYNLTSDPTTSLFQAVDSAGGQSLNDITPNPIEWGQHDYIDTNVFSHTLGTSNVTVLNAGVYEISYNVNGVKVESNTRAQPGVYIRINTTTISSTLSVAYIRNNTNNEGNFTVAPYTVTLAVNDVLDVVAYRLGDAETVTSVADSSMFKIKYLGST